MRYFPFLFLILFACSNAPSETKTETSTPLVSSTVSSKESETNNNTSNNTSSNMILVADSTFNKNYNFGSASQTIALPLSLVEISGLSYYPPKNQLLAINDERGWVFFLNSKTGEIEDRITFSGNGDFEGVEWQNGKINVVKSNGDIYTYDVEKKEKGDIRKTKLSSTNDIEGLTFYPEKNELLLACKGNPNIGDADKYKKSKNVFRYDFAKDKIEKKPFLSVEDKELEKWVKDHLNEDDFSKSDFKKFKNRVKDFSPSGISISPMTKEVYLLSSQGKTLIIFDVEKKLKAIALLDAKIHRQPEGICFAPNGDLFISNEGKGLGAKLMRYDYIDLQSNK